MDVRIGKNFTILLQKMGEKVDQGLEQQTHALTQHIQKLEQTAPQSARLPIMRGEDMVATRDAAPERGPSTKPQVT